MSKCVIDINRSEVGDGNHVLIHIDSINRREGLPQIDRLFLSADEAPHVSSSYIPKTSGVHLILPLPFVPFVSFAELNMTVYWSFLNFRTTSDKALDIFVKRYGSCEAASVLAKCDLILAAWNIFSSSDDYLGTKKNIENPLLSFQEFLKSEFILKIAKESIMHDKQILRIIRTLSDEHLSSFFDNTVLLKENIVFNLSDLDFIQITSDFFCQMNQLIPHAG